MDGLNPLSKTLQGLLLSRNLFQCIQFRLDMLVKHKIRKTKY